MTQTPPTGLQLQSLVKADETLEVFLADVSVPEPGPDEVIVAVEAAPINPSDLGLLFAGADMTAAVVSGSAERPVVTAPIPHAAMRALSGRVGTPMPVGNEGAGTVVAAGSSAAAQALVGKRVAVAGGSMYAQFRRVSVSACLQLPDGMAAADGASSFVNPMTVLGMIETMRLEDHSALVHTAAASNLGQMLNRLCIEEQIKLVNIVRKPEQEELLRSAGASYVCNSSSPDFMTDLTDALTRDRGDPCLRCRRRRQAYQPDPHLHGGRGQRDRTGLQPVRVRHPQAGLHLRIARPRPDRTGAQLRHCLGRRRLAADPVPAEDRLRRCRQAHAPGGGGADNHLRQQLHR